MAVSALPLNGLIITYDRMSLSLTSVKESSEGSRGKIKWWSSVSTARDLQG
jgi:hypothetical protein